MAPIACVRNISPCDQAIVVQWFPPVLYLEWESSKRWRKWLVWDLMGEGVGGARVSEGVKVYQLPNFATAYQQTRAGM